MSRHRRLYRKPQPFLIFVQRYLRFAAALDDLTEQHSREQVAMKVAKRIRILAAVCGVIHPRKCAGRGDCARQNTRHPTTNPCRCEHAHSRYK